MPEPLNVVIDISHHDGNVNLAKAKNRSDLGGMLVLARAIWSYPSGSKELEDLDDVAVYRRRSRAQAAHG